MIAFVTTLKCNSFTSRWNNSAASIDFRGFILHTLRSESVNLLRNWQEFIKYEPSCASKRGILYAKVSRIRSERRTPKEDKKDDSDFEVCGLFRAMTLNASAPRRS